MSVLKCECGHMNFAHDHMWNAELGMMEWRCLDRDSKNGGSMCSCRELKPVGGQDAL